MTVVPWSPVQQKQMEGGRDKAVGTSHGDFDPSESL